jgi:hypothetical protein
MAASRRRIHADFSILIFQYPAADRERIQAPAASSKDSIPMNPYYVKRKC